MAIVEFCIWCAPSPLPPCSPAASPPPYLVPVTSFSTISEWDTSSRVRAKAPPPPSAEVEYGALTEHPLIVLLVSNSTGALTPLPRP